MEATQAQSVVIRAAHEAKQHSPRVTHIKGDEINAINILPGCVDIFMEDGSRIFVYNANRYTDGLKFEVK